MATIDNKDIILEILRNNGTYPGDPQAAQVWSYINDWGKQTYAIFMSYRAVDISISPYVHHAMLLWDKNRGLTAAGKEFLKQNEVQNKS